ncbi:MAG: UDP-glucose 4-epimerase GalE [Actinomycetota bacterium]|nr:UDP-glucose 4-epimerase GalE [Actinomycetota bacterium]
MMWLVTGGAGYIGAHIVRAFREVDVPVAVLDDLSSGHPSFVPDGVPFARGSVLDTDLVRRTCTEHDVVGVVHTAGFKYAGVSVERPLHTYEQNVEGTRRLLAAMTDTGVGCMVFSGSAAVYGTPTVDVVTEDSVKAPESPYGESKLVGEWLVAATARVTGLRHTSLRYFNVVGSAHDDVYDTSPHNLIPLVLEALTDGRTPRINGDDYDTPDGTCVRDYLHVGDLANAHVAAATALAAGRSLQPTYNCGGGEGMSVRQIMDSIARATGIDFEPEVHPRRAGDPARIVASGQAAARDLGWTMTHSVDEMMASAWKAWNAADTAAG